MGVTGTVGRYLLDGTLPAADVTCHRDQPAGSAGSGAPAGGAARR
jgi:hypothetical protein